MRLSLLTALSTLIGHGLLTTGAEVAHGDVVSEDAAPEVSDGSAVSGTTTSSRAYRRSLQSGKSFTELVRYATGQSDDGPDATDVGFGLVDISCKSFEDDPRDPGDNIEEVRQPWAYSNNEVCKLLVTYPGDGSNFVCSGALIGPYHLVTARHCTYDPCRGEASSIMVSCGFGYRSDATEYSYYGTAFASRGLYYPAYQEKASCSIGGPTGTNRNFDIQILRLDRAVGDYVGWYGWNPNAFSNVNIQGYPGNIEGLSAYYTKPSLKRFLRFAEVTETTDYQYKLSGAWAFGGESGGPYYEYDAASENRYVTAVHQGGPTGCYERGTRLTTSFVEDFKAIRGISNSPDFTKWSDPPLYCQVIHYEVDFLDTYTGSVKGVGPKYISGQLNTVISSKHTVADGSNFQARITLFNVGNMEATVRVRWYASDNEKISTSDMLLDEVTISRDLGDSSGRTYRLVRNIRANWGVGTRYIGAIWDTTQSCDTHDGFSVVIGRVSVYRSPTPLPPTQRAPTARPPTAKPPTRSPPSQVWEKHDGYACRIQGSDSGEKDKDFDKYTGGAVNFSWCMDQCASSTKCKGFEYRFADNEGKCEIWHRYYGNVERKIDPYHYCYWKRDAASQPGTFPSGGNDFIKQNNVACGFGGDAKEGVDMDKWTGKSLSWCRNKCTGMGNKCYGYDYDDGKERCRVFYAYPWSQVPKNGVTCWVVPEP